MPAVRLEGTVEADEVYVVAGHKGNPAAVAKKPVWTAPSPERRARSWHAGEGEATDPWPDPARVRWSFTCWPTFNDTIPPDHRRCGRPGFMHPYGRIFDLCPADGLGLRIQNGCHGRGEYAGDEDGDGFCSSRQDLEGFWSLLRSWLRPTAQFPGEAARLSGFFEFVDNTRQRGKALPVPRAALGA